jgi:hypothetical protein
MILVAAAGGYSFTGTEPAAISAPVAIFTDPNPSAQASEYSASVNWGDGTATSAGAVTGSGGSYQVSGSHSYAGTGYYTVTVHITDDGGSTADAQTKVLIYGTVKGGSFAIGDGNAAPAAFKGFEDQPARAACGQAWTTDPGNSTPPPSGPLPAYMAVIVSSSITQSGSAISGNTPGMVVVKTNGGYAPDPGHAGTGTVIAKIC